jgi:hypothetical protein
MTIVYAMRVFVGGPDGKMIQDLPEQPQPYGTYNVGDEYFFDRQRYSIQRVGHGVMPRPDGSFFIGTVLTLGIPPANLLGGDGHPWPW